MKTERDHNEIIRCVLEFWLCVPLGKLYSADTVNDPSYTDFMMVRVFSKGECLDSELTRLFSGVLRDAEMGHYTDWDDDRWG